jgi:ATP-binding cassette subfamily F protein uup
LYAYKGNYSTYLQKREERLQNKGKWQKAKNLMRTELEWMRRMPAEHQSQIPHRRLLWPEKQSNTAEGTTG